MYLWYPTRDTEGREANYPLFGYQESIVDRPTSALEDDAPIFIFSHGRRGIGAYSYFLAEFFAAQGWLVAAVDHVGDRFTDFETPDDIYTLRPQDISALLDFIYDLPADHPISGKVGETVVMSGHSFGGYTTLALAGRKLHIGYKM